MSVKHSLLAVLAQQDCYGYQLKQEIELRTGGTRSINVGQIYTTLERLERDGLVTRIPGSIKGQRRFSITPAGRAESETWLRTADLSDPDQARSDIAEKLALALTLPDADSSQLLAAYRQAAKDRTEQLLALQREVTAADGKPQPRLVRQLLLEEQLLRNDSFMTWLDRLAQALQEQQSSEGQPQQHSPQTQPLTIPVGTVSGPPGRPRG